MAPARENAPSEKRLTRDWVRETTPGFLLDPARTALLIIDMQYASACRTEGVGKLLRASGLERMGRYRFDRIEKRVVPSIRKLLRFFRERQMKIIYITLGSEREDYTDVLPRIRIRARLLGNRAGARVHEILDELKPTGGETILNKTSIGAFTSTPLDAVLRHMGVESLVFTGVSTSHCVETTLRQGADLGYHCVLAEDACAEDTPQEHAATLHHVRRSYGRVETTLHILRELRAAPR